MYKVFIGSISYKTEESALTELFSGIADFDHVNVIKDQMTGRSRGFAFAAFNSKEGADEAIEKFNGYELDSFTLNVAHAKEKKRDGGGNRGGGSRGGFGGNRNGGGSRGGFGGSRGGSSTRGGFGGNDRGNRW